MPDDLMLFEDETWAQLPQFLDHLPRPVALHVWGNAQSSHLEMEALRLAQALSQRFEPISYRVLPRRIDFPYYPVVGVLGLEDDEAIDFGLRFIGPPSGLQLTSFVGAIQSVAFRGMTSEARTRIHLQRLTTELRLELITSAEDEAGTVMAHQIFNMAVASPYVRAYVIMGDLFPDALLRYSVSHVPHLVIDGRVHVDGVVGEDAILRLMARATKTRKG
jgi:alkyl hydroperoxide reductase subunit AhpF